MAAFDFPAPSANGRFNFPPPSGLGTNRPFELRCSLRCHATQFCIAAGACTSIDTPEYPLKLRHWLPTRHTKNVAYHQIGCRMGLLPIRHTSMGLHKIRIPEKKWCYWKNHRNQTPRAIALSDERFSKESIPSSFFVYLAQLNIARCRSLSLDKVATHTAPWVSLIVSRLLDLLSHTKLLHHLADKALTALQYKFLAFYCYR